MGFYSRACPGSHGLQTGGVYPLTQEGYKEAHFLFRIEKARGGVCQCQFTVSARVTLAGSGSLEDSYINGDATCLVLGDCQQPVSVTRDTGWAHLSTRRESWSHQSTIAHLDFCSRGKVAKNSSPLIGQ